MNLAPGAAERYVLTLDLRDDASGVEAYRRYHAEVWPEVVESFARAGVRDLDLYVLGRRLVMVVEVPAGADLQAIFDRHRASHPRVAEWERLMKTFQQPAPDAREGEWWATMERLCRFGDSLPADPDASVVA